MRGSDKYIRFEELKQGESRNSFTISVKKGASGVAILAPHGGGIEPGTSEIAEGIAGTEHSCYTFNGRKRRGNHHLHITSTNFDEPVGLALAARSERVLTVHGCSGKEMVVYLGGLDTNLKNKVWEYLTQSGFKVAESPSPRLQGAHPNNVCNRSRNGCGVQMELSDGLRRSMFEKLSTREGRAQTTETFNALVAAVRRALTT